MIAFVSVNFKRSYERVVAARERLIELRGERIEALLRLRMFVRAKLGDFLSNVDPVTNVRYADLVAEGSKAFGDMNLALTFFDGTRLRVSVDGSANITFSTVPDVLGDIARIVDLRVRADLSSAEFDYVAKPGDETTEEAPLRTADFAELLDALVEQTVLATEGQLDTTPVQTFAATARGARRSGLSFNIR